VAKAASLRLKIGGVVGLMEKAEMSGMIVGESGGG
jgi:predicted nucleic acid-binding protein